MVTEKGTLPVGVEYAGQVHREYEIRPQKVGDSIDVFEDERAQKNNGYFGICVLARQIVRLGGIPKEALTPTLLLELYEDDIRELHQARERVEEKLRSFRNEASAA